MGTEPLQRVELDDDIDGKMQQSKGLRVNFVQVSKPNRTAEATIRSYKVDTNRSQLRA